IKPSAKHGFIQMNGTVGLEYIYCLIILLVTEQVIPPSFIKPLVDMQEILGSFVQICSPLKVTWYKHDTKVTDGGNYKTSFIDSVAVLELLSTSFDDDGVYTCEAQNDAGSVSCSTTLTVKGQPLTDFLIIIVILDLTLWCTDYSVCCWAFS
uniref:Ig-like domain-containing protein n=1 Tax=Lates calcarifer TaxID=8187 RepID=A0A4W6E3K1_LATCA